MTTPLTPFLRGKLPGADTSEDLLTGIAFGVLAQLPAALASLPLLATLDPAPPWLDEIHRVQIDLWPWWGPSEHLPGAEPDAVLRLWTPTGRGRLLAVECKRGAGKSGQHDQLARQAASGARIAAEQGLELAGVVYLTEHLVRPDAKLYDSRMALKGVGLTSISLMWGSWLALRQIVLRAAALLEATNPTQAALCFDLAACLERWGLARFEGLTVPSCVPKLPTGAPLIWPTPLPVPTLLEST